MSEGKGHNEINEQLGDVVPTVVGLPQVADTPVEELLVEETKVEEPTVSEIVVEEPMVAEVQVEKPLVEETKVDEQKVKEPKVEEPKVVMPQLDIPRVDIPPVPRAAEPYIQPQQKIYDTYQFSSTKPVVKSMPKKVKKKSGTGRKFALCIALALVFGLVSGAVFLGVAKLGNNYLGNTTVSSLIQQPEVVAPIIAETEKVEQTVKTESEMAQAKAAGDVAEVAANVMPSVVAISNIGVQEVPDFFGTQEFESESSGSGIIVGQNDTELLVATNNHVVVGAKTITVTFIDKSSVEAQIKGTDADNDLAVVAVNIKDIEASTLNDIKVVALGNSDELVVGEQVVAIGNALGYGQSVTAGYVSALDREVTVENVTANLIQTDAAINPGNSGGALLNMKGELIGINAVKFAANGVEGMGYAIPISTAQPILGELMNRTTRFKVDEAKASYLGVTCRAVTEETAQMYNMPVGVFIAEVASGSAAEKAGIQKSDIIIKFDGTTIKTYNDLVDALQYYAAGESVDIVIARADLGEYKEQTVSVTLDSRPADLDSQNQQRINPEDNQDNSGNPGGFQLPW